MELANKMGLYCKNPERGVLSGKKVGTWLWIALNVAATFWLVMTPRSTEARNDYYYIHVSSYKAKSHAVKAAADFEKRGYSAVVRGEEVPKLGYWYRIYLGPFSSYKEAKVRSDELKKSGLVKYTAIYQKESPILEDMAKPPQTAEKTTPVPPPTQRTAPPVIREPVAV